MSDPTNPPPDLVTADTDPGDETARRYRYQWTYAAIVCCMLLDKSEKVIEVFCEHHEDVLIKYLDNTFAGLQIKTRGSDQPVWKISDEAVKQSLTRFSKLESKFPNQFRSFRFLTNHPLHVSGNSQDIRYVLQTISDASSVDELTGRVASLLRTTAQEAECSQETAFSALSKTLASDDLPKLKDIEGRLVDTLAVVWERAAESSHSLVRQAARFLASTCGEASSLFHIDLLPAYFPVTFNPNTREVTERLEGKRVTLPRVLEILDKGLRVTEPLESNLGECVEPGDGDIELLQQKLDAGGFSAISYNSAKDLRDKADYLAISWTKKYGRENGLQRYNHINSLVLRDAARAFELTKAKSHQFGPQMLNELSEQFRQRKSEGDRLYGCSTEHLEGFAFSLTSQCKVCWSLDRPWESVE